MHMGNCTLWLHDLPSNMTKLCTLTCLRVIESMSFLHQYHRWTTASGCQHAQNLAHAALLHASRLYPKCLTLLYPVQIPVRVVYLDSSGAAAVGLGGGNGLEASMHDFVPEACPRGATPRVHLLYRPGHYDVLYPRAG